MLSTREGQGCCAQERPGGVSEERVPASQDRRQELFSSPQVGFSEGIIQPETRRSPVGSTVTCVCVCVGVGVGVQDRKSVV